MKRTVAVIAAVVALLLALASAALGAGTLMAFGTEGTYRIEVAEVRSEGAAVYVRAFGLDQQFVPEGLLEVSLTAANGNGQEIFLGVAKTTDLQSYLTGVPYDAARELGEGAFVTNSLPGSRVPALPAEQSFWIAARSGNPAVLPWQPDYRADVLMIMNADSSTPVSATLGAELGATWVFPVAIAALALAALLLVIALWLLLRAGRRRSATPAD